MESSKIKAMRVETKPNQVRILIAGRASYFKGVIAGWNDDDDHSKGKAYSSGVLLPKDCPKAVINVLNTAVKDAVKIGIETKWNGVKPSTLKLPVRNGDEKYAEDNDKYASHKGMLFFNCKKQETQGPPIIKAHGQRVTTAGVIESGDWCSWDLSVYPYNHPKGGKGVGMALNGCVLIMEGERFGGGPSEDSIEEEANKLYGDMFSDDPLSGVDMGVGSDEEYDPLADMLS